MRIKIELRFNIKDCSLSVNDVEALQSVLTSDLIDHSIKLKNEKFPKELDEITINSTFE